MPQWKPAVLEAFQYLNIDIDTTPHEVAAKAYKTQAMKDHPDKNHGDASATQRFQKLGQAWDICQKHYENPARSYVPERGAGIWGPDDDDDDYDMRGSFDPDMMDFFRFMFEQMFHNGYTRADGRRYRNERRGRGNSGFSFSFFQGGYTGPSIENRKENVRRQTQHNAKQKAEYEQRLREFELEIEAEERERRKQEEARNKDDKKIAAQYEQAFKEARAGNSSAVISSVKQYGLDVNSPEARPKATSKKPAEKPTTFESLLHTASRSCDETLILFLLEKGADPDLLNHAKLYPFHVSILFGNVPVAKFFLQRRLTSKTSVGCHPSKAAPDGRTPLQLAIASASVDMIALMTKEATSHDVERCFQQTDVPEFKEILSSKKGFVDPKTKDLLKAEAAKQEVEQRKRLAEEKQRRAADERARNIRLQEEKAQKRAAAAALRQEQEALEAARRREAEEARKRKEAEDAAHRKAELEARQKMAAEARFQEEQEAWLQAEAEKEKKAAEARAKAEAEARKLAEERARARKKAEENARLKKLEKAEAKRRQREAEAEAVRQAAEAEARRQRQAAVEAEAAAAEAARLREIAAAQEAERKRLEAKEQQRAEERRVEALRQAQEEEERRQAEAKAETQRPEKRRKAPKKAVVRDLSHLTPEQIQRRAEQSARDKARIAEQKRVKAERDAAAIQMPGTPESMDNSRQTKEEYIPPTPVSMPSPSQQRRVSLIAPSSRPAVKLPEVFQASVHAVPEMEDIQTAGMADDLFAVERPVAMGSVSVNVVQSVPAPPPPPHATRGRGRGRGYYRGRGRGLDGERGRGRGRGVQEST
ncbi:hypothetical protein C8J57DRAFT_1317799 [Mycena rebaudengoi]|nr:hypothetical protein C8J57DRAFT_1317799 [Mycena rebaudengoi]